MTDDFLAGLEITGPSDRTLVERTVAGDREAFTVLHKRYYARIYRLAIYRCRNTQDAEDVAAETFVKAIAHLPQFRFQGESLFPWLSRIATNLVHDQARRTAGVSFLSLDGETADQVRSLLEAIPGTDSPDPHAMAERAETQALVRAAVAMLPADQAEAVLLRFGSDLPLKEIALALNRTEGAIKSLLHRALVNLRKSLITGAIDSASVQEWRQSAQAVNPSASVAQSQTNQTGPTTKKRYEHLDL
ncbi:MAG: RNA polymerase sigma factor [Akkermansiaceae bacterium]|nr:RNA polymerase sigma factor [Armatimonadota bacterium]